MPLEVVTFESINERVCFVDLAAQRDCFYPQCGRSGVARSHILAFYPTQLAGHLAQLDAQGSDELDGLSDLPPVHRAIFPHTRLYPAASGVKTSEIDLRTRIVDGHCAWVNSAFLYGDYQVKLLQCMGLRACVKKSGHRLRRFSVALPKSRRNFPVLTLRR